MRSVEPLILPFLIVKHAFVGQFFGDWLGWLTNDDNGGKRKKRFEATMDLVERELNAAGVRGAFVKIVWM